MKRRHRVEPNVLERLKKEVENFVDFPLRTPDDYIRLAETLLSEGCGYVSATTLKRIWGYISDTGKDYSPSAFSLDALCKLIGFKNIEEFSNSEFPLQSKEYTGKFLESRLLPEGATVEIRWQPNRFCRLNHIKATLFRVEIAENSSVLRDGDMVECVCFTQHAPVHIRIFRDKEMPTSYIAGSANGITYKLFSDSNSE